MLGLWGGEGYGGWSRVLGWGIEGGDGRDGDGNAMIWL